MLSVFVASLVVRKLSRKTRFVNKTDELLVDMSKELRRYIKKFECKIENITANRIIIYRVFPFEFSSDLFPELKIQQPETSEFP